MVSQFKSLSDLGSEVQEKNRTSLTFNFLPFPFIHGHSFKPYRKAFAKKEKHTFNIYRYVFENHLG